MNKYKCSVCGYMHGGEASPQKCPQCGARGEKFAKPKAESHR